jgi:ATP-dependent RNA helicase RhlE
VTRDPVRIEAEKTVTPNAISQVLYNVPEHAKFELLQHLLEDKSLNSVLVFARTKYRADRIAKRLQRVKIPAAVIHGNRSQGQRVAALESFRRGHTRVLVATDIAARGIDVEGISHVVNYDVPMQPEDYVHRIGRTGRAKAAGQAYTLATPQDSKMIHRIEYVLKEKIQRRTIDGWNHSTTASRVASPEEIRRYVEANRRKPKPASVRSRQSRKTGRRRDSGVARPA